MSRFRQVALVVVVGLSLCVSAWAEELDPLIKGLDDGDPARRAAAVQELTQSERRDELVVDTLRSGPAMEQLGPEALKALSILVGVHELPFANRGLRRIVRNAELPLPARRAAAQALVKVGGLGDVSALGDVVQVLPVESTEALVNIGGNSARRALIRGAGETPPSEALAAMALLGDTSGLPQLVERLSAASPEERPALGKLLLWGTGRDLGDEPEAWAAHLRRRELAGALAVLDSHEAQTEVERLVALLKSDAAPPTLADDLIAVLGDSDWHVFARDKAALVLGLAGVHDAQPALLAALQSGQPGSVRLYSADALSRMGDLSVVIPMVDLLIHDEDRDRISARRTSTGEYFPVDPAIVRALYRRGLKGGAEIMIMRMGGEFRTRMHRDCLRALREVSGSVDFGFEADSARAGREAGNARMWEWWDGARDEIALAPAPDAPGWSTFRTHVAEKIKLLGTYKFLHQKRAKETLVVVADVVREQIEAALTDADLQVRIGAADVLRGAGIRAAAPALAAALVGEQNDAVATKLLGALTHCGRPRADGTRPGTSAERDAARSAVLPRLAARALGVRIRAAQALGVIGTHADTVALQSARAEKRNADQAFRAMSAGSLLRLGDASAAEDLLAELACEDIARRADALGLLTAAGVDDSGYAPDASPDLRNAAIERIRGLLASGDGVSPGGQK